MDRISQLYFERGTKSMAKEDKMYDLLEKLYIEMQNGFTDVRSEMKGGMEAVRSEMQEGLGSVRGEIGSVRSEMQEGFEKANQRFVKLEDKLDKNLKALYDGYSQNTEAITRINHTVGQLSKKIETHNVAIKAIRKAK
mgnify:CR=1 FL=1